MSESKSADGGGKRTLVEEGTEFKGALTSSCPIDVKGRVEGDLTAPSLTVSAAGAVHGKVKVGEMRSEGEIAGEFDADVVKLSGTVKDNTVIRAKSLEVKLSPVKGKLQVIFGECELDIGDAASAEKDAGALGANVAAVASPSEERPARPPTIPPPKAENGSMPPPANVAS